MNVRDAGGEFIPTVNNWDLWRPIVSLQKFISLVETNADYNNTFFVVKNDMRKNNVTMF